MPAVMRAGIDVDDTRYNQLEEGSENVFVNGAPAGRVGDAYMISGAMQGSSTVFINGKPVHRVGDLLYIRTRGLTGSENVFAGG